MGRWAGASPSQGHWRVQGGRQGGGVGRGVVSSCDHAPGTTAICTAGAGPRVPVPFLCRAGALHRAVL